MPFDWNAFGSEYDVAAEVEQVRRRSQPSPGKVSLTAQLPRRRAVVQRKASRPATAPRAHRPVVQLSDDSQRFGERRSVDDQWEDATTGLTSRQKLALSTCHTYTANLFAYAVMPKPQWDILLTQCEMLTRDVGTMLGSDITTRARAELAPALAATNRTKGAIEGARQPEPKVREMATSKLSSARFALSQIVDYGVWVDDTGNVRVQSEEELDALIEKNRPKPAEEGEEGEGEEGEGNSSDAEVEEYPFTIEGTNNEIVSKAGEDAFKKRYMPFNQDQLRFATQIVKLMGDDMLKFEGFQQEKSKLKDMEIILRGYKNLLQQLAQDGLGERVAGAFAGIMAELDNAHAMVVAKLASTLPVALSGIQNATVGIEQAINNTLALPRRIDPNWPEDADGDGEVDRRTRLETRGLRRTSETTRLQRADPLPDDDDASPPSVD